MRARISSVIVFGPAAAPGRNERFESDVVELVDHLAHPVTGRIQRVGDLRGACSGVG